MMNKELSSKAHLPGVKAHLEGGRGKNTSGVSFGSPEVDNVRNGFTLVEMLVVMAITAIAGIILVVIFTNTLLGSNKSQILSAIKQNGQSVLENMDKTIRNSDNVVCPSLVTPSGTTLVVVKNGVYIRYRFINASSTMNGLIQQDNPAKQLVEDTYQEETDSQFINRVCTPTIPITQPTILTDTNTQYGVSVKSGSFTRNQQVGFKDSVSVLFALGPGADAPAVLTSQIDDVTFQTTVQLR